jgi:hypothetical protein
MKCVHCLKIVEQETKDHVFPKSWYPDNTPDEVQRWTVPSCAQCNGRLGRAEKGMFVRLALCADPTKAQASGMSKKALRTLGIGVADLEPKEKAHRVALLKKVFDEAKQLKNSGDRVLLPGAGPHPGFPGFPADEQLVITIPDDILRIVSEKIIRGCEYKLNDGAYVEEPLRVKIYFVHDKGAENLTAFLEKLPVSSLGPGFEIRRGQSRAQEGDHVVLYRVTIWGTFKIYAAIDEEAV